MLKLTEVAERLNCSLANVYSLIDQKKLGCFRVGSNGSGIRVDERQIEAFLEERREHPGKQEASTWSARSSPSAPRLTFRK